MRIPSPVELVGDALGAASAVPRAVTDLVERTASLLDRVERLVSRVEAVVDRASAVTARADQAVTDVDRSAVRAEAALDRVEPLVVRGAPVAQRFLDELADHEVEAAVALVDRLPRVLEHLDADVLPMLRQLDRVGPDVHALLETVEDMRRMLDGLPGMGLIKRRGRDGEDED